MSIKKTKIRYYTVSEKIGRRKFMQKVYSSAAIAARVKNIAKSKNIVIKQMLSELGLAKGTMENFKTSMPKSDNLAYIADYLDCSVDYLLGRTDNPNFEKVVISSEKKVSKQSLQAVIDQLEELKNSIDNP